MRTLELLTLVQKLMGLQVEFYSRNNKNEREDLYKNEIFPLFLEIDKLAWEIMPSQMAQENHVNLLKINKSMEEMIE